MVVTEEQAKQLECPKRTYCVNERGVIADHEPPIYAQATCIGSWCMWWRWAHETKGYCGAAGKP